MVYDSFSCIKEVTKTVHLTLPTVYNSNEISGICDALESWKRQYVQQLQGIVVSYKNVSLISKLGYLKIDYPVVHYNVKATFELFYPTVGSIVKGKINRVSHDYISCLVHNTINVAVHQTGDIQSDISELIALDRFILFQITRLNFKRKVIHVKGKITEECITLMKESDPLNVRIDVHENNQLTSMTSDFSSCERIKSTNDVIYNNNIQTSSLELQHSTDTSSQISSSGKKKKRKKSKDDLLTSPSLFNESLESEINEIEPTQPPATTSKKKHKKSKTETVANEMTNNLSKVDFMLNNKEESNTDSSNINISPVKSHKKKKFKTLTNDSPGKSSTPSSMYAENLSLGLQNSVNELNHLSSSTKKKKRKKSKEDSFESPSYFDDVPKKKHKKSKSKSADKELVNNFNSLLSVNETHPNPSNNPASPTKSKKTSKNCNDIYEMKEAFSSFVPSVEGHLGNKISINTEQPLDAAKQAKKRKRESSDINNLPKKKRKTRENTSDKSKDKAHKKKKKKKEKSEKDSKKDKKKKSKDKVISTKKRLHGYKVKLKKKSKDKSEKPKISKKSKSNKEK